MTAKYDCVRLDSEIVKVILNMDACLVDTSILSEQLMLFYEGLMFFRSIVFTINQIFISA